MIVVDASIAAKLYRDEPQSGDAHNLFAAHAGQMLAPDIFVIELAGVIVRDANTDKFAGAIQAEKLEHLSTLLAGHALRLVRTTPDDIIRSAELAIELGHPLKDCIYLDLAIRLGHPLVTADARFAAKARHVWPDTKELTDG